MVATHHDGLVSIIEDDESVRTAFKRLQSANGFDVEVFASAEEFLRSGRTITYDDV